MAPFTLKSGSTQKSGSTRESALAPHPARAPRPGFTLFSGVLAVLVTGSLFSVGGLLSAGAASAHDPVVSETVDAEVAHHTVWPSPRDGDYWTPERMRAAVPGDELVDDPVFAADPVAASGDPVRVPPQAAEPDGVSEPVPQGDAALDQIGRVFLTLQGIDYSCSGNAVAAANENTVATAAHCVSAVGAGYASRLVFVPAYANGFAPFGLWEATALFAPTQWTERGDLGYDTAFAVVASPTGVSLSDTVGASGVLFNADRGLSYTAYGYPAEPPFDGATVQVCDGDASADPLRQSDAQGISCDMLGGASGGPWFENQDGLQNSVNSYRYNTVPAVFGPYWGSVIESVYAAASA